MLLRLLHVSDNHSILYPFCDGYETADLIVHSGDFLPNKQGTRNSAEAYQEELKYQENWLYHHEEHLKKWIGNKEFIFCPGNHDFIDPTHAMRRMGINAVSICNRRHVSHGLQFYGFPFIPWCGGRWNFEKTPQDMRNQLAPVIGMINAREIDVLVAHAPIYGILDKNQYNTPLGITAMRDAFNDEIYRMPKAYLCGHVHGNQGLTAWVHPETSEAMLISQAATTSRLVEIEFDEKF
jgi:Icc-related predicted phosphoesterase